MSYLLAQILLCLLIAGLIGALIGWLLRGSCGSKISQARSQWENDMQGIKGDYSSQTAHLEKELGELKNKLADTEVELSNSNDTWTAKLREHDTKWEGEVQGLKSASSNSDGEISNLKTKLAAAAAATAGLVALESKLSSAESDRDAASRKLSDLEAKLATAQKGGDEANALRTKLSSLETEHNSTKSKLGDLESKLATATTASAGLATLEGKLSSAEADRDAAKSKLGDLESKLSAAQKEAGEVSDLKSKLAAATAATAGLAALESKLSSAESDRDSAKGKLGDLESKLSAAQKEASEVSGLRSKLSSTEGDLNGANKKISDLEGRLGTANKDAQGLKAKLDTTSAKLDDASLGKENCHEIEEIEGIGPAYGKKLRGLGLGTTCDYAQKVLGNGPEISKIAKELNVEVAAASAWASMADLLKLPEMDGQYAEILQAAGVHSRADLSNDNAGEVHGKMVKFNSEHSIVPEVPGTPQVQNWVKAAQYQISKSGVATTDTQDCYEIEEIEGVGPAYGKKLRSMGMSTTCDYAKRVLGNANEASKVASELNVTENAAKAWSSMADLLRLPGVDGQFAEILQAAGLASRGDLKKSNASDVHRKMTAFNNEHSIVPEVPSSSMVDAWIKAC